LTRFGGPPKKHIKTYERGILKMTQWKATLTTYEPWHRSRNWGRQCIEVGIEGEIEIPGPIGINSDAVLRIEKNGGVVRFFTDDISYRELREYFD
jgi:hypothetical protein